MSADPDDQPDAAAGGLVAQQAARRAKVEALVAVGIDPYPENFERTALTADLHSTYADLAPDAHTGDRTQVGGRLAAVRGHGQLIFATVTDHTGTIQLLIERKALDATTTCVLENMDIGDWIGAEGEIITSRRGELSIQVTTLTMLCKTLRPLPEKWRGVTDPETRYRQREVDLLANESTRKVFDVRFATIASLRAELEAEGFVEVETPILQPQAGGAIARPFMTHSNALDTDLSLRIAPELYLKRLVVGGYERVFEIGKDFRNEGIDTRHSPEFTAMEAYRAFGDYHDGMDLTERLIVACAQAAIGGLSVTAGGNPVDLTPPWPRRELLDLVSERVGTELHPTTPVAETRQVCDGLSVNYKDSWGSGKLIFEIYDKILQANTVGPVFVCGYPVEVSPLAKRRSSDPTLAERFELVIDGREFANGYSELNDPDDQEKRFAAEGALAAAGDLEAHPADADFVRALQYGLPPTSGIGIGVDRLVMLLAEVAAIRDVILFPLLRPRPGPSS